MTLSLSGYPPAKQRIASPLLNRDGVDERRLSTALECRRKPAHVRRSSPQKTDTEECPDGAVWRHQCAICTPSTMTFSGCGRFRERADAAEPTTMGSGTETQVWLIVLAPCTNADLHHHPAAVAAPN